MERRQLRIGDLVHVKKTFYAMPYEGVPLHECPDEMYVATMTMVFPYDAIGMIVGLVDVQQQLARNIVTVACVFVHSTMRFGWCEPKRLVRCA